MTGYIETVWTVVVQIGVNLGFVFAALVVVVVGELIADKISSLPLD